MGGQGTSLNLASTGQRTKWSCWNVSSEAANGQSFLPVMAAACPATEYGTVTITVHNGDIINCIVHIIDLLLVLHHYPFTNEFTALFSHT